VWPDIENNGGKTAEVPVLRLRQAFWLFAVVRSCFSHPFFSGRS